MKIFIAWSKEISGEIGNALHDWLIDISEDFTPFISTQDIRGGNAWLAALGEELQDSYYGILCVTEENVSSPWLCYEAGALGIATASHDKKHEPHVLPILFGDVKAGQIASPLQDFQSKPFTREEMLALVVRLNRYYRSVSDIKYDLKDEREIKKSFNDTYDDLESKIRAILIKAQEARTLRENDAKQARYDALERALRNFQPYDSDETLFRMGQRVLAKFRHDGLNQNTQRFAKAYLAMFQEDEDACASPPAGDLQDALTELIEFPTAQ